MGRHYHFRSGQFYRADDRTGFPQYADRTRKQWDNLIVDESVWEPRQPQDLVRGVKDVQSVEDARPLPAPEFTGPFWTTVTAHLLPRTNLIPVESFAGFRIGDTIAVMTALDGGTLHRSTIINIGNFQVLGQGADLLTQNSNSLTTEGGLDLLTEDQALLPALVIGQILPDSVLSGAQIWNYGPVLPPQISALTDEGFDVLTTENGIPIALNQGGDLFTI